MNADADGLSNGSAATDDRFHTGPLGTGPLSPAGLGSGGLGTGGLGMGSGSLNAGTLGASPMGGGSMAPGPMGGGSMGSGSMGSGSMGAGQLTPFRGGQRRDTMSGEPEARRNGSSIEPGSPLASVLDSGSLKEPVLGGDEWLDHRHGTPPLADHPLLRGLLLELPPKGIMPTGEWLDRWFEAARSILELLYAQHGR